MKIYTVLYSAFDGECSYDRPVKAFTKENVAIGYADLCIKECERIQSELDSHYEKHKDELAVLHQRIRSVVLERKGKRINLRELPESIRSMEINSASRDIMRTHKYDPNFRVFDDDYSYTVEELELD